jgi:hypothetical protein
MRTTARAFSVMQLGLSHRAPAQTWDPRRHSTRIGSSRLAVQRNDGDCRLIQTLILSAT